MVHGTPEAINDPMAKIPQCEAEILKLIGTIRCARRPYFYDGVEIIAIGAERDAHGERLALTRCCVEGCGTVKLQRLAKVLAGLRHSCGCLSRSCFISYYKDMVSTMTVQRRQELFDSREQHGEHASEVMGVGKAKIDFTWPAARRTESSAPQVSRPVEELGPQWLGLLQIARRLKLWSSWAVRRMLRMAQVLVDAAQGLICVPGYENHPDVIQHIEEHKRQQRVHGELERSYRRLRGGSRMRKSKPTTNSSAEHSQPHKQRGK